MDFLSAIRRLRCRTGTIPADRHVSGQRSTSNRSRSKPCGWRNRSTSQLHGQFRNRNNAHDQFRHVKRPNRHSRGHAKLLLHLCKNRRFPIRSLRIAQLLRVRIWIQSPIWSQHLSQQQLGAHAHERWAKVASAAHLPATKPERLTHVGLV